MLTKDVQSYKTDVHTSVLKNISTGTLFIFGDLR
jgi:hypothetical protein